MTDSRPFEKAVGYGTPLSRLQSSLLSFGSETQRAQKANSKVCSEISELAGFRLAPVFKLFCS